MDDYDEDYGDEYGEDWLYVEDYYDDAVRFHPSPPQPLTPANAAPGPTGRVYLSLAELCNGRQISR